ARQRHKADFTGLCHPANCPRQGESVIQVFNYAGETAGEHNMIFSRTGSFVLRAGLVFMAGLVAAPIAARAQQKTADQTATATPIKHLVVIYGENVSFEHYFATYPNATNPPGEPVFTAAPGTPRVNNL